MNSKSKGNTFERDMSRMLSLWWTNGKRDDAIWRSASSGALTTVGKGRYLAHTGDFAATDAEAAPLFDKVIIEAKRGYNRYSMQDLLDIPEDAARSNPVWEMFKKLAGACNEQEKVGLLLWKRDRRDLLAFSIKVCHTRPSIMTMYRCLVHTPNFIVYGDTWKEFSSSFSGAQIKSLLDSLDASSVLTPSTPS